MSENRKLEREKRRIPCEFRAAGRSQSGLVANLSARGLYVQCSAMPADGAHLDLLLHDPEFGEVQLWGRVVRTKPSHRTRENVEPAGFGVVVESASEAFFRLVTTRDARR